MLFPFSVSLPHQPGVIISSTSSLLRGLSKVMDIKQLIHCEHHWHVESASESKAVLIIAKLILELGLESVTITLGYLLFP